MAQVMSLLSLCVEEKDQQGSFSERNIVQQLHILRWKDCSCKQSNYSTLSTHVLKSSVYLPMSLVSKNDDVTDQSAHKKSSSTVVV